MTVDEAYFRKAAQEIKSLIQIVECCEDKAWLEEMQRAVEGRIVLLGFNAGYREMLCAQLILNWCTLRDMIIYQLVELSGAKPSAIQAPDDIRTMIGL